ncbi:MAG: SMP-30/gluconolactonase/LRE family protein [Segetibacter sp.]
MKDVTENLEVVLAHTSMLGECPVWDDQKNSILWLDIVNGDIHEFYPKLSKGKTFTVRQIVGAIRLRTSGGIIAALQNGFAKIDVETGVIEIIGNPESHINGNRFNDGKCDPAGRFWAGTMSISETWNAGNVYVLEPNLSISKKIKGVTISNGMVWSLDRKTFYYIDTPSHQVVAYNYHIVTGNISHKRVVIDIPEVKGYPDGMTIDTEGMLWVALWNGWKVTRWNPYNGKLLYTFSLPVANVSSCVFGGDGLGDLYITSARSGLNEKELTEQPLAGSLFVIKNCGFKGVPEFRFKG